MYAVVDYLQPHPVVTERGDDGPRGAVVDTAHAVKGVGEDACPGVEGVLSLLVVGVAVTQRNRDAAFLKVFNRGDTPFSLRGEGQLGEGARGGVDKLGDFVRERVTQQVLRVSSLVLRAEERALRVDPQRSLVSFDLGGELAD